MSEKDLIIAVAKIVREHGIPRAGIQSYKAMLINQGSRLLENAKSFYLMGEKDKGKISEFKEIKIISSPKALGGKWGESSAVILPLDLKIEKFPVFVGIKRENFPKLAEGEIYLCDLMNCQIAQEKGGSMMATITGFFEVKSGKVKTTNFSARSAQGLDFEFPAALLKDLVWDGDRIVIRHDLSEWIEIYQDKDPQSRS